MGRGFTSLLQQCYKSFSFSLALLHTNIMVVKSLIIVLPYVKQIKIISFSLALILSRFPPHNKNTTTARPLYLKFLNTATQCRTQILLLILFFFKKRSRTRRLTPPHKKFPLLSKSKKRNICTTRIQCTLVYIIPLHRVEISQANRAI